MQRKPGFPVANCSIKVPDNSTIPEAPEDEKDAQQRRLQLINFGHAQWGFNNWNWLVTKQELDFVDITGGKYTAGVAAFVSVSVKSLDIHRENVGYATTVAATKGMAIHGARKCAVTNALRETLLSFGGAVASELLEALEPVRGEVPAEPAPENSPGLANLPVPPAGALAEPRNSPLGLQLRKEAGGGAPGGAKALPAASRPPANAPRPPAPLLRPASNEGDPRAEGEDARAERKRRQRLAQEEFRLKQLQKLQETDNKQDLDKISTSADDLLMAIPTQDIIIEDTGNSKEDPGKRKSPATASGAAKRRGAVLSRLDIV